jgi:hypothetical protein
MRRQAEALAEKQPLVVVGDWLTPCGEWFHFE